MGRTEIIEALATARRLAAAETLVLAASLARRAIFEVTGGADPQAALERLEQHFTDLVKAHAPVVP